MRLPAILFLGLVTACGKNAPLDNTGNNNNNNAVQIGVQDVSDDGLQIAYTNAQSTLFVMPVAGGTATQVATQVQRARFKGKTLVAYQALDAAGVFAGTMLTVPLGTTSALVAGTQVVVESVRASEDGDHLYFESQTSPGVFEAKLDGSTLVSGASKLRGRFSPTNNYLVFSSKVSVGGSSVRSVKSYPLAGGAPITLLAANASMRFDIAANGLDVVVGSNHISGTDTTTISRLNIAGGGPTTLAANANETDFRLLDSAASSTLATLTLIYSQPDSLERIQLDGTGGAVLKTVGSGVVDTEASSINAVVYATFVDAISGLATLRFVRSDGTGDLALGTAALDLGFTQDDGGYLFLSDATVNGWTTSGTLKALDVNTGTITVLGSNVTDVSELDATRVAFIDSAGTLKLADLTSGVSTTIDTEVTGFAKVPDALGSPVASQIAYSRADTAAPGFVLVTP